MLPSEEKLIEAVKDFCTWAESVPHEVNPDGEARLVLGLLSRLYVTALEVKSSGDGGDSEDVVISDLDWKKAYERAGVLPFNYYNAFFSPSKFEDKDPVVGDLADDIADIYRDLKEGIQQYLAGNETEALWSLKQTFRIHWGRPAASAIYAIHAYFADDYGDL